jgi:hypothetical protein
MSHLDKHFNKYGSHTARAKNTKIKHDKIESESKHISKHNIKAFINQTKASAIHSFTKNANHKTNLDARETTYFVDSNSDQSIKEYPVFAAVYSNGSTRAKFIWHDSQKVHPYINQSFLKYHNRHRTYRRDVVLLANKTDFIEFRFGSVMPITKLTISAIDGCSIDSFYLSYVENKQQIKSVTYCKDTIHFDPPLNTETIRLHPVKYTNHPSAELQFYSTSPVHLHRYTDGLEDLDAVTITTQSKQDYKTKIYKWGCKCTSCWRSSDKPGKSDLHGAKRAFQRTECNTTKLDQYF